MTAPISPIDPEKLVPFADAVSQTRIVLSHSESAFALLARIMDDRDHEGHHGLEALKGHLRRAGAAVGKGGAA